MFINHLLKATVVVLVGLGLGVNVHRLDGASHDQAPKNELPPIIRSGKSGLWSAPATWDGGKVPAAGQKVYVAPGHSVVYDVKSDQVIRSLHLDGTLTFAHDKDTRLDVGLIRIQAAGTTDESGFDCDAHLPEGKMGLPRAALLVGTPNQPIDSQHTALIRLVYINGMDKDSCPAIVCCGGQMDFHGTPLNRTWVGLGASVKAGDTSITLNEYVTGWKAGDRIIVTLTNRDYYGKGYPTTEERIVKHIDGTKIVLDKGLTHDHLGAGDYRAEVANLSRNVTVESANPEGIRGHTMYHRDSRGAISYAEFRHLGKAGVLGRYSLHFHLVGDTMRGSYVLGASIWDSHNRWLTIHGTNYLVVRDCVGYKSLGHGFFLEDGTEVFNVLDRNLAVGAQQTKRLPKQVLAFDANDGAGFWWANSLNTFTRNIAAENGVYGFRYEATPSSQTNLVFKVQQPDGSKKPVDIRTLPFVRFDDNETHSGTGVYGLNLGEGVDRVGPDTKHPFIVRNLKIWDTHYGFRAQVPSLLVENLRLHHTHYGIYHPNYENHVYRNVTISRSHTEPFNRGHDDDSVQYGKLTVDGLTFDDCSSSTMPLIQISDDNPTGKAETHLRNVKTINWKDTSKARALVNLGGGPRPTPNTEKGVPIYLHDWYGAGKHAQVSSTKSGEFKADPTKFKQDFPLTGNESRVAAVSDLKFPKLLDPVDDLPPTTVITHIRSLPGGKVLVQGTTADNGTVKRVLVNGKEAKAVTANFAQWEIELTGLVPGEARLTAHAEDAAGNVEPRPHVVSMHPKTSGNLPATKDGVASPRDGQAVKKPPGAPAYPLKKSANGRYLVDQKNVPFLIAGDSPQCLMVNLTEADAKLYFANRKSHGFNTVWISLLWRADPGGRKDGSTFDGVLPFKTRDDLSTPNEAYFARCDRMIELAAKYGFLVLLGPCETGSHLNLMVQNGVAKCRAYGQYLGKRYSRFDNILWMSGNDYGTWMQPKHDAVVLAVALGIKDNDTRHIHTIEVYGPKGGRPGSSLDAPNWVPIISLNATYTYSQPLGEILKDYNRTNFLPVFLVEAGYEFAGADAQTLRRQEYWTLTSGACGQIYGSEPLVFFSSGWKSKLDSPGSVQMAYVTALFEPLAWYNLVPDQNRSVITEVSPGISVSAGRTPDGSLVMAYIPSSGTITADMAKLCNPVTARWYDPTNGKFQDIAGSPFSNSGSHRFSTPGKNSTGDGDWILVLKAMP